MSARVGRNVLSNWAGLGVSMAVAFLMAPFLVHTLGDAQYGVWVLILSVTGYMGLLDAGLKVSVVKFIASQSAEGDSESLGATISTALAIYSLLAIVLLLVAAGLSLFVDDLFDMPSQLAPTARTVLIISGATLSVTLLSSVFNGFLAGLQRYDIINSVGIGSTLVGAAAIYAVVSLGMGIVGLGLVHLSAQALSGLLLWWMSRRLRPQVKIGIAQVSFARVRQLYGYGLFILLNSLAMLLLFRSGELVAGVLLGAASVTYFAIGGMLVEYLGKLIGSMTQVLHPLASGQHARGDHTGLKSLLILSTRACIAIALPACAGFVIVGKVFISAWMGSGYAEISAPILALLAVGRLFWLAQSGAGNILLGAGGHRQLTLFTGATGLIGIAMAILLAGPLGLIGIAAGLAISTIVCMGLIMPIYLCRTMGIKLSDYLRGAVAGPVIATLPFSALLYFLIDTIRPATVGAIALIVAMSAPVFLITAYFSCLDRNERERIAGLIANRRG